MNFFHKLWIIGTGSLGLLVAILLAVVLKKSDEIDALKIKNEGEKYTGDKKEHNEKINNLKEKDNDITSDITETEKADNTVAKEILKTTSVIEIGKGRINRIKNKIEEVNAKKNKVDSDSSDFYSDRDIH